MTFDGVDDRVVLADSTSLDLNLTGSFTLAAWIHPTEAVPSGAILHKAGASGVPFALGLAADGTPFVRLTTSAGTYTLVGDEPVFPDQWTHVAATYNAGAVKLFVNGIKEWSGSKFREGMSLWNYLRNSQKWEVNAYGLQRMIEDHLKQ